jgi:hypothetical protein
LSPSVRNGIGSKTRKINGGLRETSSYDNMLCQTVSQLASKRREVATDSVAGRPEKSQPNSRIQTFV